MDSKPISVEMFDAESYDQAEKTEDDYALIKGFAETVTLLVGQEEAKFLVHKDILCAQGGFFMAAFKKEWMSADDQMLRLPTDHPEVISTFLYWTYRKRIYLPCRLFEHGVDPLAGCFGLLAKLWVLSDKYYITPLQNDVIDAMITCYSQSSGIPPEIISFVYENTSQASSPIRMLLVRFAEEQYCPHVLDKTDVQFPAEFLYDMWRSCLEDLADVKCPKCDVSKSPCRHDAGFEYCFCVDFHYHGGIGYGKTSVCTSIKPFDQ